MSNDLIRVNNLFIDFMAEGIKTNVINDLNFCLEKGKITAIVGESGSGKSVTAMALLNLLPKQTIIRGEALFKHKTENTTNLLQTTTDVMNQIRGKDIAMVFQEPMTSLNPVFTVGYQIMETILLHQKVTVAEAKNRTISLFTKVNLPEPARLMKRYPHELSGGQKQRVMIAMAISCNPALLIADEPTTALDVTVQKRILQLIKEIQLQTNMSVLFISHDLGLVSEIADNIIVMQNGKIIEQGSTASIMRSPQQAYTKKLLACQPANYVKGEKLIFATELIESDQVTGTLFKNEDKNIKLVSSDNDEPEIVLSVEKLKVYYPSRRILFGKTPPPLKAVDDVSFKVKKGETLGLVGESGCGKTSLVKTILQLIVPTSGKIILNGQDLTDLSPIKMQVLRKDLQIVFQDPYGSLNPRLTIGKAILEPMQVHSVLNNDQQRKNKVYELLEKVNLSRDFYNRYPHQFSGGQRQRICIARALALDPSFLIFDESVSALDVSAQAQVLNLLTDLKKEFGFSAVFISHNLAVVHYFCDRIMVMQQGKIVEEGFADKIYFSPENNYTKSLISAIPGKGNILINNPDN